MTNKEIYDLTKYLFESWERGADYDSYHTDCQYVLEGLLKPEQEPVIWTKTWFEDGKVVTQHLTAKDIYKEPEQEPVVCCGDYATCMKSCTPRGRWLAEQEPEPHPASEEDMAVYRAIAANYHKDLSTPPKREWVGLTDKQKKHAEATCMKHGLDAAIYYVQITLKEKNT